MSALGINAATTAMTAHKGGMSAEMTNHLTGEKARRIERNPDTCPNHERQQKLAEKKIIHRDQRFPNLL